MSAVQGFLQQLINGIQIGSVYALIAVGYTMVYGVLKFINFAHGDVYMVGAYIGFFAASVLLVHTSPVVQGGISLLLSMLGCALLGVFIERLAYRPLRNGLSDKDAVPWALFWSLYVALFGSIAIRKHAPQIPSWADFVILTLIAFLILIPILRRLLSSISPFIKPAKGRLAALITAIGVSLLLENQGLAIFGADPRAYQIRGVSGETRIVLWKGTTPANRLTLHISEGELLVLLAAVLLTILLVYLIHETRLGRAIRAVSYDPDAAALMGIPTDRTIAITFLIGSALAGAAGFLNHLLTHLTFDTNVGIELGLKAFIAAVLGGIGNIEGAVLGALLMGIAETFTGGSVLSSFRDAVAFSILIIVLLFRPTGLLGKGYIEKV
ncbi:amino acid/amide ABC transporter membrane protein 1, HAAT family [Chthonomonas calidirosea]|uniref:Amino acid/amide ABC transporter membrane protein 1, HAAT family (TC 3.A.1.4.-) n=1 Tax=Chthonomonas calidirosea (strain DSM 23976 / ICMP 18418 / T49) TaxID=1303518 RepID=S0ESM1_CHTCT|nr:branched-chain amino acid ABC transporter permease [Chthonomonas calidirosea]CCW34254.1 amino acid/amide ABC transporter membrane protein 1, HAAT family (TC 3.A.1.4.-) [Chthonomonas calidirosea T49]CEK14137.1 amino acid/amide ABC transporter membrane protein 1, HAAT family [Chthonomonas calidirosea]CEK15310.1 amino acid/amide ABC transporter membrane protein 1, HAAT family [Chthonomonas calidirosea]